jgi:Big-like domain-containing protein
MQDTQIQAFACRHLDHIPGLAMAVIAGACSPSPPTDRPAQSPDRAGVQVTADRSSYRPGDPITLTVENGSADTVTFNPCTRALEREQSGGWSPVAETGRICTMEAWMLAPGARRAGPTELPGDLAVGRYRAVLGFTVQSATRPGGRLESRTAAFAVER